MSSSSCAFGAECREREFPLRKGAVFLNHGSYGVVPRRVLDVQRALQEEMEEHPDAYIRFRNSPLWCRSLRSAADFLGAKVSNLTLTVNATSGMNAVLRSVEFKPGDVILIHTWTYGAVKQAVQYVCDRFGAEMKSIDVKYPITSGGDIVRLYEDALDSTPRLKMVITDHITSCSAVLFPVKEIIDLCRSRGVLVMIDGAHAPGQVPLNLEDLNADFYVGNFHKWVFAPRACAALWVHPDHHVIMRGPITSHFYKEPVFQYDFYIQGTRDLTPFHAAFTSFEFYRDMGGYDVIRAYNTDLLNRAVRHLCATWNTSVARVAAECQAPFMQLIRFPDMKAYPKTLAGASSLMRDLFKKDNIQTCVVCIEGEIYIRLSVQIYNTLSDYEKLGDAILTRQALDPSQVQLDDPMLDVGAQCLKLSLTE